MEKKLYPKILIINLQSIFSNNATGITLRSILATWPKENLFEIKISPTSINVPEEFKDVKTIELSYKVFPLRTLSNMRLFRGINNELKRTHQSSIKTNNQENISMKELLRQCLWAMIDISWMNIDCTIKKALDNFKPDVIYTLGSSVSVMKMSIYFAKRYDINIVMHSLDNWQETLQWEKNKFMNFYKYSLNKWLSKIYKYSKTSLAISPKMAEEYTKRWAIKHSALMNSIDVKLMYCEEKKNTSEITFVYVGGLHLKRWESLIDIAKEIESVSYEINKKIIIKIYTGIEDKRKYQKYFNNNFVYFCDPVPHNIIKKVFNDADVLVHTEMNNNQFHGFLKYSISTKIPEYLSANRPVLFYGPKDIYLSNYLKENGAAVTASSKNELNFSIKQLVQDDLVINSLLKNSRILAIKNHDKNKTDKIFYDTIIESLN
jgi:hypothetical protein